MLNGNLPAPAGAISPDDAFDIAFAILVEVQQANGLRLDEDRLSSGIQKLASILVAGRALA